MDPFTRNERFFTSIPILLKVVCNNSTSSSRTIRDDNALKDIDSETGIDAQKVFILFCGIIVRSISPIFLTSDPVQLKTLLQTPSYFCFVLPESAKV